MARYRKRPVVIEAVQLSWANYQKVIEFLGESVFKVCYVTEDGQATDSYPGPRPDSPVSRIGVQVSVYDGDVILAVEGDWIIRESNGELYVCQPEPFSQTYEPLEKSLDEILAPYLGPRRRHYENLENITEHDRRSDAGL